MTYDPRAYSRIMWVERDNGTGHVRLDMCHRCGAVVANPERHSQYHEAIDR